MAQRHIALLRGINVGGRNKLPMKSLASLFEDSGCTEITTYIQSGNVVYSVVAQLVPKVVGRVEAAIQRDFGFQIPIVTRTQEELAAVIGSNPFLKSGADEKELHVAFLAQAPNQTRIAQLDPKRSPPDEFLVRGQEIYLRYPNGLGRSKLTNAYFDAKLGTVSTIRNWKTTGKLLELASG